MTNQTTNNPITVDVWRYKKDAALGLWTFSYGTSGTVHAKSAGHAFPESDDVTIEPVFIEDLSSIATSSGDLDSSLFSFDSLTDIDWARTLMCMGAVGFMVGGAFGGELASAIFGYLIWDEYCTESSPTSNANSYNANYIGLNSDDDDWFNTDLHLFETKLVSGFLQ
jgi:squalene cyclase